MATLSCLSRDKRLIFVSLLLWGIGEGLFFYIQPLYIESLGANPRQIGSVLSIAALATAISYIPLGWLADVRSLKKMILGGYAVGAVGALLLAMARNWRQLLPGLVLYSLSYSCSPAMDAYLAHRTPDGRDLNGTFTRVYSAFPLGFIFSPAIGGWLAALFGIRMVFFLSFFLFGLSTLIVWRLADVPAVVRQRSRPYELLRSHRGFRNLLALSLPLFFIAYLGQPLAPNYLTNEVGLELPSIGVLGSLQSLGTVYLSTWLGNLSTRSFWGLAVGQGVVSVSFFLVARFATLPILMLAFFGLGAFRVCFWLVLAQTARSLTGGPIGLGLGIIHTVIGFAMSLASYAAGFLYTVRPVLTLEVSAVGVVATIVLTFLMRSRLQSASDDKDCRTGRGGKEELC